MFIAWRFKTLYLQGRETHFGTLFVHCDLQFSSYGEEEEKRKKERKMTIFFLGFYIHVVELKSEDIHISTWEGQDFVRFYPCFMSFLPYLF